jgi:hypothetical protein
VGKKAKVTYNFKAHTTDLVTDSFALTHWIRYS